MPRNRYLWNGIKRQRYSTFFLLNSQVLEEDMKNVLFTDSAVTGEAAGVSIGLIMAGSGNPESISELVVYAGET